MRCTSKQFGYWLPIDALTYAGDPSAPPTIGVPNSHDIVVRPDDIVVAFAFYNEVAATRGRLPKEPNIFNPWWYIETHGGLGPDNPEFQSVLALSELVNLSSRLSPELRREAVSLAQKQLGMTTTALKKAIASIGKQTNTRSRSQK